jgi:surface protein
MEGMFNGCKKLKQIILTHPWLSYKFITNKVVNMNSMFQECSELEYLDLSTFNTENVTNMTGMFNLKINNIILENNIIFKEII